MASCGTWEYKGESLSVEGALEALRDSLLADLQGMRERVVLIEEKMDLLIVDRLQQHHAAVCSYVH